MVKLLGIDIDYQLNFNYHIKNICRKASQQLNVLKRIGCFLSKLNKLTIFHTFILSYLIVVLWRLTILNHCRQMLVVLKYFVGSD